MSDPATVVSSKTPLLNDDSLGRLAQFQRTDMEEDVAALLHHSDPMLRAEALRLLLVYFRRVAYVVPALRQLNADADWLVRLCAAESLGAFGARLPHAASERKKIELGLARAFTVESEPEVQNAILEALLTLGSPSC